MHAPPESMKFLHGVIAPMYSGIFHFLDQSFAERYTLSPKFGLRPKIRQKLKSFFFVWTEQLSERFAETKLRTRDRTCMHKAN